jgi:hypothetical protein
MADDYCRTMRVSVDERRGPAKGPPTSGGHPCPRAQPTEVRHGHPTPAARPRRRLLDPLRCTRAVACPGVRNRLGVGRVGRRHRYRRLVRLLGTHAPKAGATRQRNRHSRRAVDLPTPAPAGRLVPPRRTDAPGHLRPRRATARGGGGGGRSAARLARIPTPGAGGPRPMFPRDEDRHRRDRHHRRCTRGVGVGHHRRPSLDHHARHATAHALADHPASGPDTRSLRRRPRPRR